MEEFVNQARDAYKARKGKALPGVYLGIDVS